MNWSSERSCSSSADVELLENLLGVHGLRFAHAAAYGSPHDGDDASRGPSSGSHRRSCVERATHDALHALARVRARARVRRLRRAVALVDRRPRGLLGLDLGVLRRPGELRARCSPTRSMPGAEWFTGAELSYPEHIFRDRPGDRVAIRHASELRELGEWTWDELREQTARVAAGLKAMGVERGDRVVAYMPNIPETIAAFLATASLGAVWSSCSPDFGARSVVDRFAQIEPKVLLDGRRLPLRRQGPRPQRADRARAGRDAVARAHGDARLPRRGRRRLGRGFPPTDEAARVRARAVRPPAVGPLLLGHDRPAEGDRALAGRDPARAPQEAEPARRRAGGRPRLLVHHDRLDDVELPRRRAAHGRLDRALRRQPRHARHGRAVGPRRGDRHDLLRHQRRATSPPA